MPLTKPNELSTIDAVICTGKHPFAFKDYNVGKQFAAAISDSKL